MGKSKQKFMEEREKELLQEDQLQEENNIPVLDLDKVKTKEKEKTTISKENPFK